MRFSSTGVFLRAVQADATLDALSSGCAWFGRSLRCGTPQVFPMLGAAGVSVRSLRPYRFRAIAVVAPEVPNVDPSTSPTQTTCLYAFAVLKLVLCVRSSSTHKREYQVRAFSSRWLPQISPTSKRPSSSPGQFISERMFVSSKGPALL